MKKLTALVLTPALAIFLSLGLVQSSYAASAQQTALAKAAWFSNAKVTFSGDNITVVSDGIPNWMAEKYAKPNAGIVVPASASDVTLDLASNLVSAQKLNYTMTLSPAKAASVTTTSLGPIGILVNGAVIYNPYEGDGKTVAVTGNVYLTDSNGVKWGFLDKCNGHPGMGGMYHYHGMPPCVTSVIDKSGGPSHILGIAFDGFLIYGDKDMKGKVISSTQLDACNGITSATPEFPKGIYHYILTEEKSNRSTINCLAGTSSVTKPGGGGGMAGMGGMGQMQGPGGPGGPGSPQQGGMNGPGGPGGPQQGGMNGPGGPGGPGAPQQGGMGQMQGMSGPSNSPAPSPTPSYTTLYKAVVETQLVCQLGKVKKTVVAPVCPAGYKKISSKSVTKYVETKALVN